MNRVYSRGHAKIMNICEMRLDWDSEWKLTQIQQATGSLISVPLIWNETHSTDCLIHFHTVTSMNSDFTNRYYISVECDDDKHGFIMRCVLLEARKEQKQTTIATKSKQKCLTSLRKRSFCLAFMCFFSEWILTFSPETQIKQSSVWNSLLLFCSAIVFHSRICTFLYKHRSSVTEKTFNFLFNRFVLKLIWIFSQRSIVESVVLSIDTVHGIERWKCCRMLPKHE